MAGLQSGEGLMLIDSVVWAQYINVTDTQTATSPQQMPRQRTASDGSEVKSVPITLELRSTARGTNLMRRQ